jgi:hypothetical protein
MQQRMMYGGQGLELKLELGGGLSGSCCQGVLHVLNKHVAVGTVQVVPCQHRAHAHQSDVASLVA